MELHNSTERLNSNCSSYCLTVPYAIWLAEQNRQPEAEDRHRHAVEEAESSGDPVMHGRALGAQGIFLQHGGNLKAAQVALEKAAKLLPPSEPDAFYVQNHLQAIRSNQSCGCGDGDEALSTLAQRLVMEHAPEGLVKSVRVTVSPDQPPDVNVSLIRKPTEAEAEQLHRVVNQALAELRQSYRNAGYAR
jgi:hypothetical protein